MLGFKEYKEFLNETETINLEPAKSAFARKLNEAGSLLDHLGELVRGTEKRFKDSGEKDWAYIGSLDLIVNNLKEAVSHLSGFNLDDIDSTLDELEP